MSQALNGIRVLDLADRSAALAGRILADLGAEVILVEPPDGNPIRHLAPFVGGEPDPELSCHHLYLNASKRSVVLDIRQSDDRDRFRALVATADLVIDSERPGHLDDLGLGHDELRQLSPGLVQVSVTPFGLDTPWRDRTATDLVAGAAGGLLWVSGEPRGTPVQGGHSPSYAMAALAAASAATIALHQRDFGPAATGRGVHVDLSLQEATALAGMQTNTPSAWTWHQRVPGRPGLSAALRCRDGKYVGHLVRPDRFDGFLAWCDRVGIDHGMDPDDWEWSRLDAPRKDNPVVAATLALAQALTRDEFVADALEADIVCLPVLDFPDMAGHEQYLANDQFLTVPDSTRGRDLGFVRSPVDAMADGVTIRPAPLLGADTGQLLGDLRESHPPVSPIPRVSRGPGGSGGLGESAHPSRALEGIRVVDFGWVLAAPIGTRMLASFGAEVIRIESGQKPDSIRSQIGPDGRPDPDLGGLHNTVNAGKKSLAVDLTTDAGMELIGDLIATADVVVNNFRPGAMERMGLGYETLDELRPGIVLLNLPGAHRFGPWAPRASMGNILMAASGFNMVTGFDDERPRGIGVAYPDFTSPHLLVSTILSALRQRQTTGRGQELHLTQLSGMVALNGVEWMQYTDTGEQPARRANRDADHCPHGVFPAAGDDEWVAVAVAGDSQFAALAGVIGQPDLADDPRFADHASRKANEDVLDEMVAGWTTALDRWEAADRLQTAGIAAAAVEHLDDMLDRDPQLPDHYQIVHQPSAPDIDIPIDREAARWRGITHDLIRSPGIGEHNEHVVRDLLGRTEEEYVQLILDEVLG
ncbi:MAG: CoA transferase [Actinomycetia bacterium]|nr:CoA transferase [Actinomycetes bacterium]